MMVSIADGNIILETLTNGLGAATKGRDRGYYRRQRLRKIEKRLTIAGRLGISVEEPGRLSKTSPFGRLDAGAYDGI